MSLFPPNSIFNQKRLSSKLQEKEVPNYFENVSPSIDINTLTFVSQTI